MNKKFTPNKVDANQTTLPSPQGHGCLLEPSTTLTGQSQDDTLAQVASL